ncbi:MAG TPA: HAD family hydrolase [Patescibacteria group bacterium]|nr:HAD family hydrolase [Patescibacteria group bacterium]
MSSKHKQSLRSKDLKYKALILDVDGTLMNGRYATPSKRVIRAIYKASKILHVGLATSRPIFDLKNIFTHLKLSGPSIISGGCEIVDYKTKKVLWEKTMLQKDIKSVLKIAKPFNLQLFILEGDKDFLLTDSYVPKRPLHLWAPNLEESVADDFITKVSHIPTISTHKLVSWKEAKADILVTHSQATKQHGILEIAKILGIKTHEIIGVGDGYNDFPLLMACGLKVAMGNAVPDLKAIADYIAPTVEEDGVADVIERFVL